MAVAQSKTPIGRPFVVGEQVVTLNGSGTTSPAVTVVFPVGFFIAAPDVLVVKPNGETGTWVASSISKSQFTLTITGAARLTQDMAVTYFACEKMG